MQPTTLDTQINLAVSRFGTSTLDKHLVRIGWQLDETGMPLVPEGANDVIVPRDSRRRVCDHLVVLDRAIKRWRYMLPFAFAHSRFLIWCWEQDLNLHRTPYKSAAFQSSHPSIMVATGEVESPTYSF